MAKTFAADEMMQEVVAKARRSAGRHRLSQGQLEGHQDFREAVRIYEGLATRRRDLVWLRTGLIETCQEYSDQLTSLGRPAEAEVEFRRALVVAEGVIDDPEADRACFRPALIEPLNNLAWSLVKNPPQRPGDAALAVRLASRATEWGPNRPGVWNTLGVAYYRAGDWAAAAQALETSMSRGAGGDAYDWLFLAAVSQRQGDPVKARSWYDRAAAWMCRNGARARDIQLRRTRTEVAQFLRIPDSAFPAEVTFGKARARP